MSNDDIKDLIQIFVESGVAEMEVKRGDYSLRLRRGFGPSGNGELVPPPAGPTHPVQIQHTIPAAAPAPAAPAAPVPIHNDVIVKSPIVGTYYDAPKPGDPPFVKVGDAVEPGQVLCIIESMKLMNEIESESAGVVSAKLMENGRPVEYGEGLFSIRPR